MRYASQIPVNRIPAIRAARVRYPARGPLSGAPALRTERSADVVDITESSPGQTASAIERTESVASPAKIASQITRPRTRPYGTDTLPMTSVEIFIAS